MHKFVQLLPALVVTGMLGVLWTGCDASTPAAVLNEIQSNRQSVSFVDYDATLRAHVDENGMVDYTALQADDARLNAFFQAVAQLDRAVYDGWPSEKQIAFWINVYNGLTLKAIIDHYPIQASRLKSLVYPKNSIRQIPGVWDKLQWQVMGSPVTLDEIEHGMLRENFDEPRIHAALVCAAMGCPPLRNEAYTAERLDEQLNDQMRRFLSHPQKFRIDRGDNTVYLSKIFEWFGGDFVKRYAPSDAFSEHSEVERAVLNAVSQHVPENDRDYLLDGRYAIEYTDYDWTLNEQSRD